MICNEVNGENQKDEKWTTIVDGMKIYTAEQIEEFLKQAGFTDIETDKDKSLLCAVCKKQ